MWRMRFLNMLLAFTVVVGMAGQLAVGVSFDESLYRTLLMFGVNYTIEPANIAINIARFSGALFTLSAIIAIVESMFLIVGDRIKGHGKNSVFVYGDSDASAEMMLNNKNVIDGRNGFVDAKSYVLLGTEQQNLDFISRHRERLEGRNVYFKTEVLPGLMVDNAKFMSFCLEELGAQAFWQQHAMVDRAYDSDGNPAHLSVAVIGMGKLGEELVYYGVQENSFAEVDWHLFGDTHRYEKLHTNLALLNIHVHEAEWYDNIDILSDADMIILSHANDQIRTICDMFTVRADWKIYACIDREYGGAGKSMIMQHRSGTVSEDNLIVFNWKREGGKLEMQQKERFDALVAKLESGAASELNDTALDGDDTFSRYTRNYFLSFVDLERRLEQCWPDKLDNRERTRILHNRLCGYYWLNNWHYSETPVPDDPTAFECLENRTNRNLVDFDDLSEEQQQQEIDIVNSFFSALGK